MNVPTSEAEFQELADDILSAYERYYFDDEDGDSACFTDGRYQLRGIQSTAQGLISFLLLAVAFGKTLNERCTEIVQGELEFLTASVAKDGCNLTPVHSKRAAPGFGRTKGKLFSTDTATLVVSACILAKVATNSKLVSVSAPVLVKVQKLAVDVTKQICAAQHASGGWSFAGILGEDSKKNPTGNPDLYHTYAVSETFADIGDYVLGETEGLDEDAELREVFGAALLKKVGQARVNAAEWLIKSYVIEPELPTPLGICPIQLPGSAPKNMLPGGVLAVPPFQQGPEYNFNSLYPTFYVLDSLIVNGADDEKSEHFGARARTVRSAIEHAIYLSRIQLDLARKREADYWKNAKKSTFTIPLEGGGLTASHGLDLEDGNLLPLALRCNALYCYYVSKGPDRFMDTWMEELLASRDKETGLWDDVGISVAVTEKSIEAIVDYYDYFRTHVAGRRAEPSEHAPPVAAPVDPVSEAIREAIREEIRAAGSAQEASAGEEAEATAPAQPAELEIGDFTDLLLSISKHVDGVQSDPRFEDGEAEEFFEALQEFGYATLGRIVDQESVPWAKRRSKVVSQFDQVVSTLRDLAEGTDADFRNLAKALWAGAKEKRKGTEN